LTRAGGRDFDIWMYAKFFMEMAAVLQIALWNYLIAAGKEN